MSIKPAKVGIVGAGNVGAAIANALVLLGKSAWIVLLDRNLSKAGRWCRCHSIQLAVTDQAPASSQQAR